MELNKLKELSDISEEILNEMGIISISVIHDKGFNPRMLIKYQDDVVETIDDVTEMAKFIQNLQK